ncbi:MAG: flagellar basal body L-ring protein FlgH [Rhizobiales bacterium TMED83]|jgi:flagellar L-ring protein precursor FlgH|nr:flagellar biosynthesis protein FlgH [Rhodobiaceae bacterium]RPF94001.1 MAG: flagellar basal body L-ring protein FlgH [Rhizobiales bacterium TMED83]
MSNRFHSLSLPVVLSMALSACSTYVENRTSENFVPRYDEIMPAQAAPRPNGAIYKTSSKTGLFTTDQRARSVGDILTVVFAEGYSAQKAQSTTANKSNALNVTAMPFDQSSFAAKLGAGATAAFSGDGAATQSNSFTGLLSVSVIRVFDNGNMEVAGQKRLTLNNGNEFVRARGIVRPEDISAGNMLSSTKLADAEITYTGAGDVADTGHMGWASKLIMMALPF